MDVIYYIFAATIGTAALLASIAIWAPRKTPIRVLARSRDGPVHAHYLRSSSSGSWPSPSRSSGPGSRETSTLAEVLSVSFRREGKAIYMWLRLDGMIEPRFYSLPWRQQVAEDLEDAMEQASRTRSNVIVKDPFSKRSLEERGGVSVEIIPPGAATASKTAGIFRRASTIRATRKSSAEPRLNATAYVL